MSIIQHGGSVVVELIAKIHFKPPNMLDFKHPEDWPCWKQCFQQFRVASGLNDAATAKQISMLLYAMGKEAEIVPSIHKSQMKNSRCMILWSICLIHFSKWPETLISRRSTLTTGFKWMGKWQGSLSLIYITWLSLVTMETLTRTTGRNGLPNKRSFRK